MLTSIGRFILDYVITKLVTFFSELFKKLKNRKDVSDESKESVKPLKDAVSGDDIEKAAKDTLGGL